MATHNTEKYVARSLDSIESVCSKSRRPYHIYVADDSSSDSTARLVKEWAAAAPGRPITFKEFGKASCVGESKNRAVKMAVDFISPNDWVLFMDDDDEMLDGRIELVRVAEKRGLNAVVGNIVMHDDASGVSKKYCNANDVLGFHFSPPTTAVSGSLIPRDGRYFVHAPVNAYEDLCTHSIMASRGVQWVHIETNNPVLLYHVRSGSFTRGDYDHSELLNNSIAFISSQTIKQNACRTINVRTNKIATRSNARSRPRISIICRSFGGGGVERWVSELVAQLSDSVDWVGLGVEDGITARGSTMCRGLQVFNGAEECVKLARLSDISICWLPRFAHRYKYESSSRLVLTHHTCSNDFVDNIYKSIPVELFTAVHSCSNCAVKSLPGAARVVATVIHNSVSPRSIEPDQSAEEFASINNISLYGSRALYLGRFSPEKNWLRALAGASESSVDTVIACGALHGSDDRGAVINLLASLSPKIRETGWVRSVGNAIQLADLMVSCSQSEAFQYSVLEGALAGVPIVSNRVGVLLDRPEIASVTLSDSPSIPEIAAACDKVLAGSASIRKATADSRLLIASEFNMVVWREKWLRFLGSL